MGLGDTIYALASAPGRAGVAVVRASGARAGEMVRALAGKVPSPRQAVLAKLTFKNETLDHALVLWMPGPASFTGEDVVEFHLHGGRAVVSALYEALGTFGRMAEPGEFTRRAVMNGKMDLTAAEAVADLVDAETLLQKRQALAQMEGVLARLYGGWHERLKRALAHLEAAIDFAEDDLPDDLRAAQMTEIAAIETELRAHLDDKRRGERLRSGLSVAILGAPNAGKSSLLNLLAQRDVAIVTDIPGTTRDVLEVACDVGGYPVTFADTAGLRDTADVVEAEGVRRAHARAGSADFKILVFDVTALPDAATLAQKDENSIIVFNKTDLLANDCALPGGMNGVRFSAQTGAGLDYLLKKVAERAEALTGKAETPALTRARHRAALSETAEALARARQASSDDQRAEDVRLAMRALGGVTGAVGVEDLLDVIFRDFCIGK